MMPRDKSTSRRQFLRDAGIAAGLAAVPIARPGRAQTKRQVTVRLDWIYQGPNAGFMVAQDKGFYAEAGLNVEVGPGKGSGSTAQLVAGLYRRNPTAIVVLADSDIKTPKDLEGKTVAIAAGSTQFQQWPAFVKGCGLDGSKIRVANIDPAGSPPALITGQVPAIAGYALGQVPSVEIRGNTKARIFWYADCGVTAVSNCIVVHNDLIKEEPELVRAFISASLKGFLYGRQNLDEMIAIARKYSPAIEPAIARREAEMSWQSWISPNTAGKPFGWMAEKDWEETVEVLKQYGGVTTPLAAQQLYTNEFVPTGVEFIPPPADADKK